MSAMLLACGGVKVPETYTQSNQLPQIYPDYTNVTVPVNIAPLTFQMDRPADEMVARFTLGDKELLCGYDAVQPDADDWRELLEQARGKDIKVEVFSSTDDQWTRYQPFTISVSPDPIDPYISYRVIPPSFRTYENLTIRQRCLENYDESVIYNNALCSTEKDGQCINCHHYQNYNPGRMQFHARQNQGGTVIAIDGDIRKINMKNDSILSAGVYPAWHPTLDIIVYSTNKTSQSFQSLDHNKIEVYDSESDLIAYDIKKNQVANIENDPNEFEVFPCWSPDGKSLYYCSAYFNPDDSIVTDPLQRVVKYHKDIKYNIYRKSFDPDTYTFGPRCLVYDAAAIDSSATLPRISPDGRYLMFTIGQYGCFHIWHHDADLCLMDLQNDSVRRMSTFNSPDTESYHSWSSNGRWVIFSSRRDDGVFTRPFIGHIDADGRESKPFELPSAYPDYHRQMTGSYNIPEFMRGPVDIQPQTFAKVLATDGEPPVKYVERLSK